MKDPYVVLGVTREADADVIKAAYHALLKKYHPDKAGNDPAGVEKFLEIRAAWKSLSDSRRREPVDWDAPRSDVVSPHSTPNPQKPPTRSAFGPPSEGEARSADRASVRAEYSALNRLRDGAVALIIYGVYGVSGVVLALLALVLFG